MTTAIFPEDTNTYNLCPSSKSEMVTKKRASFTDDIVISGVTITGQSFADHHLALPVIQSLVRGISSNYKFPKITIWIDN